MSEFLGTAFLVFLGNATVANVVLKGGKGEGAGWLTICIGWGLALFVAVWIAASSGAHVNPAISLALASVGKLPWNEVPGYIGGQFAGAAVGQCLVVLAFMPHWAKTSDAAAKLACFSTGPAIRALRWNAVTEAIATFALVFGILTLVKSPWVGAPEAGAQGAQITDAWSWFACCVGALLCVIGIGLGGPTGFALNPARDLAPRIVHAVSPLPGKGSSDWEYAWVPVVGPIVGAVVAAHAAQFFGYM